MAATERATNGQQTSLTPKLSEALLAAQAEMPSIPKDATNPHFRNKYASLDSLLAKVLPVLNKHGIVLSQHPTFVESITGQLAPALRTVLMHGKSGEVIEDTMLLVLAKEDPQGQGAALTYARRYALSAALGLNSEEDDDGNVATRAREPEARVSQAAETPSFVPPTLKPASAAKLTALKAQVDALVDAGHITEDQIATWSRDNYGTTLDKLPTVGADELKKRLDTFAKNVGTAA